jgi:CBS domain-containing protein
MQPAGNGLKLDLRKRAATSGDDDMMTASDVMTREVTTVSPETPVQEIATLLYTRRISGVPVVDHDQRVVGMVSEGDLMTHSAAVGEEPRKRSWWLGLFGDTSSSAESYSRSHARTAADIMSRKVIAAGEDQPLSEIARLLEKNRIKRVPVLRDGRLVGIVSRANLLQALAVSPPTTPVSADDREIDRAIAAEISGKPWGTFANVIVKDGVVHLWGFIDTEAERKALVLAAQNTPGVIGVEDHLVHRMVYGT